MGQAIFPQTPGCVPDAFVGDSRIYIFADQIEPSDMKISLNWLKDYIAIPVSPEDLSEILTNLGLEVEGMEHIQSIPGGLEGIVIGHVVNCIKHPNADRLWLTTVDIGSGDRLSIVCGAPNVAKGQKVPVAPAGTTLFPFEGEAFKIKKGKIRGEVSEGMICAEDELGISSDHSGIMILPSDLNTGAPLNSHIPVDNDVVYDIGLTPNRSDATSHLGVARDLAAYFSFEHKTKWKVQYPEVSGLQTEDVPSGIEVVIEDEVGCPRYSGISLTDVVIRESPQWLQKRLKAIGVRPINNIVDITNYVLHEYGQPLHAFDQEKIGGQKIIVKCLPENSTFLSLDGIERTLGAADLMICDGDSSGMCIAGVYGGQNSGVTETTKDIFLESAHFDATRLRRTSTSHLLRTDAAKCFEKGTDPNGTVDALQRAAGLMVEWADARINSSLVDVYPKPIAPAVVVVRLERINTLIGNELSIDEVGEILDALSMAYTYGKGQFVVGVPTDKSDVTREADVIEEILRIYGFNRVQTDDRINTSVSLMGGIDRYNLRRLLTGFLGGRGYNEMMGLSLIPSKTYENGPNDLDGRLVLINNTSNSHLDAMRPEMMLSMLESVSYNHNRQQGTLRFFEFGATYLRDEENYIETQTLGLMLTGDEEGESWLGASVDVNFFSIKRTILELLTRLGIERFQEEELKEDRFEIGVKYHQGPVVLVRFGAVADSMKRKMGVKGKIYYAELMLDELLKRYRKHEVVFQEVPKFPSIRRDLALVIDKDITYQALEKIIKRAGGRLLSEVNLFDVYVDDELKEQQKKSYAIAMTFVDHERSLRDVEVDRIIQKMIKQSNVQLGAQTR